MTYTFKPGEYKTRDGRKAVVLCDDAPGNTPLKGYIVSEGCNDSAGNGWTADGHLWPGGGSSSSDLLPPVQEQQEVVRVIDLYQAEDGSYWACADGMSTRPMFAKRVGCTRVVLTPGRFDTEDSPSEYDRGWNEALDAAASAVMQQDYEGYVEAARVAYRSARDAIRALRRPS